MPVETHKIPMFLKFLNRDLGVTDLLSSFSRSDDTKTANAAVEVMKQPPDLEEFRKELGDAVEDLIKNGLSEELKAFANNYMGCLEEDVETSDTPLGESRSHVARVKDSTGPWVQGFICYNLCLYIKVFGLDELKKCRVCGKIFAHKGKFAVYCSEPCKSKKGG
jgi:hypothetical protein